MLFLLLLLLLFSLHLTALVAGVVVHHIDELRLQYLVLGHVFGLLHYFHHHVSCRVGILVRLPKLDCLFLSTIWVLVLFLLVLGNDRIVVLSASFPVCQQELPEFFSLLSIHLHLTPPRYISTQLCHLLLLLLALFTGFFLLALESGQLLLALVNLVLEETSQARVAAKGLYGRHHPASDHNALRKRQVFFLILLLRPQDADEFLGRLPLEKCKCVVAVDGGQHVHTKIDVRGTSLKVALQSLKPVFAAAIGVSDHDFKCISQELAHFREGWVQVHGFLPDLIGLEQEHLAVDNICKEGFVA